MIMILEARADIACCQHVITQQANQIAHLLVQAQGVGPSIAQGPTTTLLYSKKIEIFNDPGECDGLKAKFEE